MIYIIEVPHRLPPTAWSADTLQDAHARIEACDTTGDIDNDEALPYIKGGKLYLSPKPMLGFIGMDPF
jgi:hypothetical protein